MKKLTKALSWLLSLAMVLSLLPGMSLTAKAETLHKTDLTVGKTLAKDDVISFTMGAHSENDVITYYFPFKLKVYMDGSIVKEVSTPQQESKPDSRYTVTKKCSVVSYSDNAQDHVHDHTLKLKSLEISDATIQVTTTTYDGNAHLPNVTVKNASGETLTYNTDYMLSASQTDVGTYSVTVTGKGNYTGSQTLSDAWSITKGTNRFTTPPVSTNLAYTGEQIPLLSNGGAAKWGTIQYSMDNESWSTEIPKKTDVGTYTVYYKVPATENYDEISDMVTVSILQKPAARNNLTYTGEPQELVTAPTIVPAEFAVQYSLDGTNWSTEIPKGTDVGNYTVKVKYVGDGKNTTFDIPVTIALELTDDQKPKAKDNLTYTGEPQELVTAPTGNVPEYYTVQYSLDGTNWSADPPMGTNAGDYTVKVKYVGDENHKDFNGTDVIVTISKINPTYTIPTGLTATYGQTLADVTLPENWAWVENTTSVGNVGTNSFSAIFTPTDTTNYNTVTVNVSVSVSKAAGSIATISTENMSWSYGYVYIEGTAGQEYIIVPKGTEITAESWQSSLKPDAERDNWVFFTGLTPATEYVIYTRTAETDTHNAGEPVNANVHTDLEGIEMDFDSDLLGAKFTVKTEPEIEGLTYKWYLDTVTDNGEGGEKHELTEIADATGSSYTFRDADVGKHIAVKIFRGESEVGETNTDFAIAAAATVTFDSKGGREAEPQTGLSYNSKVTEPEGITRSGYILAGWYADEEYDIKWDFDADTVKWADTTLYAKWTMIYIAPTVTVPVSGEDETVNVTVSVSGDTATITKADIDKVLNAEEVGTVTVDVSTLKNGVTEVVIPGAMVEKIADAVADESSTADGLEIKLPTGTVTFDAEAVAAISEQADGKDLRLNLEDIGESKLSAAQKDTVKDMDIQGVLDAYMTSNGKRISDFKGGKATVAVSYELKNGQVGRGIAVWYVADNGEKTEVPAAYSNQEVSFTVEHFSNYVIAYDAERAASCPKDDTCPISEFTDADANAWYHDGVHFVLENKLMSGYGNGKFGPADYTSRAMVVQILWNLEGKPASTYEMNYTDVAENAWYADAIRWATEKGIVTGYGDGKFGPDDNITREQLAAIIYRYAQSKGQGFTGMWMFNLDYEDATSISDWASEAMHWMVMKGIIKGQTDKTLAPKSNASRAEIATMIMRYAALEK